MNPERDQRAEGSRPSQEGIGNGVHQQKRKEKRQTATLLLQNRRFLVVDRGIKRPKTVEIRY